MTSIVIGAIALSSISWSLFDLSRKKLAVDLSPVPVAAWLMIFQALVFIAFAPFDGWTTAISSDYLLPFVISVAINTLSNIWFVAAVSLAPLSLAIPMLSLTPVFSALGGQIVLGEGMTPRQIAGIAIIVATTVAIGIFGTRKKVEPEIKSSLEAKNVQRGLMLMAVVALLFALVPVVDKVCLRYVPASEHGFLQSLVSAAVLGVWIKIRGGGESFTKVRSNLKWFIAAVLFATSAVYFQLWSIQTVPVGIFEALKRSYGLIAALALGYFFFKEPLTKAKAILVLLMGVGIFVLLA